MEDLAAFDAVILCGGLGKRLQAVTAGSQKVMADINGRPFLDILITYLKEQGIRRIVLCTGHQAEAVEAYYSKNNQGCSVVFSREDKPLGTAGALKKAFAHIRTDPFFVLNGDSYCPADLTGLLRFHKSRSALATVVVTEVNEGGDYGNVVLDASGKIVNFEEKRAGGGPTLVNAGIYCFSPKVFSLMPEKTPCSLEKEVFTQLVGNQFVGHKINEKFIDIGTPQRYTKAKMTMMDEKS